MFLGMFFSELKIYVMVRGEELRKLTLPLHLFVFTNNVHV